jgi:hypothetical protein
MDSPDADRPVAKLHLDTRSMGPLICEDCEKYREEDAELEDVLLMEDGSVCCPNCKSTLPPFEQFSSIITSVEPVRLKRRQRGDVGRTGAFEFEDDD